MIKNKKGFTIIELLVVIAIIGLLATLAVVSLRGAQVKARDTKRLADLKQLQTAVELYYSDNADFPSPADWDGFESDLDEYISSVPIDSINDSEHRYIYMYDSTEGYVLGIVGEELTDNQLAQGSDENFTGYDGIVTSFGIITTAALDCSAAQTYCLVD